MLATRTRLPLALILALGALFRLGVYLQARDGSILYFHRALDTDMNFFDGWARLIAGGELLAAPRPYHPWHDEVARQVHALTAPGAPYDEQTGRRLWDRWLGAGTLYQDPLYAYTLAAVYAACGVHLPPVLAFQAALGLAGALLLFVTARRLWDDTVGLWAAALAVLYAPLVFYELILLRGVLMAFFVLAAVCGATLAQAGGRRRHWIATGAAGGLAILTHAVALPLSLLLCASAAWAPGPAGRKKALAWAFAGLALALLPLALRNSLAGLPPWSSGTAQGYGAHNAVSSHAVDANPRDGFPFSAHEGPIFARTDARFLPTLRAALATHPGPGSWLALMGRKVLAFFDGWENADNVNFYYFLLQAPLARLGLRFALLLPLAALGVALCGRRAWTTPPLLAAACVLLGALLFFTASRVRLSAALCLVPFAAAGLVEAARRLRTGRLRSLAGPALAAAAAAVLAWAPWWPRPQLVRPLDYRAGNELALARAGFERQNGRGALAARVIARQIATEPSALRALQPSAEPVTVPAWAVPLAGSFAALHRAAVQDALQDGRPAEALAHAEHARLLGLLARRAAERSGG
jgi:4-amino-4-deoxy-L-arabinose transferase-like glycosyltransferase